MLKKIIRKEKLPAHVGLQRTAIEDAIRRGEFPRPIKLGQRAVGWLEEEVAQWQRARIAERNRDRRG